MSEQPQAQPMTDEPLFYDVPTADRQWAMFAHLSALVVIWTPWLGFLGPLIVWLIKKDEMRFVDDQGKEALNFQLNILLLEIAIVLISIPLVPITFGLFLILLIPLLLAVKVVVVILAVAAAVKVNAGEAYRYPYVIRLVK